MVVHVSGELPQRRMRILLHLRQDGEPHRQCLDVQSFLQSDTPRLAYHLIGVAARVARLQASRMLPTGYLYRSNAGVAIGT